MHLTSQSSGADVVSVSIIAILLYSCTYFSYTPALQRRGLMDTPVPQGPRGLMAPHGKLAATITVQCVWTSI